MGLAVAVSAVVLFGPDSQLAEWQREVFAIGLLVLNGVAAALTVKGKRAWLGLVATLVDVAAVGFAGWATPGQTSHFLLALSLTACLMPIVQGAGFAALAAVGVAAAYAALQYAEFGEAALVDPVTLSRIAAVGALGVLYATAAAEAARERRRSAELEERIDSVASHARNLARDKSRLRGLSEIGRLGLVGSSTSAGNELFEITRRVQAGIGVDRCSLVVFNQDGSAGFVAASSDDERVEVRGLKVGQYPELQAMLANGQITEVHPHRPQKLWSLMCDFLPEANTFQSFLVVPIKADDTIFGAFYLRDQAPDRGFDDDERDFCWAASLMTASFLRGRDLLDQLTQQSRVDGLTGLLNFHAFSEELNQLLADPRAKTLAPFTIAVLDMDNLKPINDKHGHVAGNIAITELGDRLKAALPNSLAMCRYGGDEFVALVHGSKEDTIQALETMLNGLTTMEWEHPFNVRTSIGVSEFPLHGVNAEQLLEAADQAMYLAKSSGGHRLRLASAETSDSELYDAVVSVQARRVVPNAMEQFNANLGALQRHVVLGLQSPLVRESIAALMDAVEERDPHSKKHSRAVSDLSKRLAEHMRLSREDVVRAEIGAYLHDVGKINLPPEILTKEGMLTPEERCIVQRGPEEGARILEQLPGLRGIAELVSTYQERWDGSGYPRGLAGEDIPIVAQVIGICDVYNALVSDRAQRAALEREQAQRLIEQEIGRMWNPAVAQAFLELLAKSDPASSASSKAATGAPRAKVVGG